MQRERETPPDALEAESTQKAVLIRQWQDGRLAALGDESADEWMRYQPPESGGPPMSADP